MTDAALVLDCSATIAWLMPDEHNSLSLQILDRVVEGGAIVPALWPLEVANALLFAERRGRIANNHRTSALRSLTALPIDIDPETAQHAWSASLDIAHQFQLTAYDAAYLELARRCRLPLATLDHNMLVAADKIGVGVFQNH